MSPYRIAPPHTHGRSRAWPVPAVVALLIVGLGGFAGCASPDTVSAAGAAICRLLRGLGGGLVGAGAAAANTCPSAGDHISSDPTPPSYDDEALHAPGGACDLAAPTTDCASCIRSSCCVSYAECLYTSGDAACEDAQACVNAHCTVCAGGPT
jgi:hypothetical protein